MVYYLFIAVCSLLFTFGLSWVKPFFLSFARATASQLDVMLDASLDEDTKQKKLIKNLQVLLGKFFLFMVSFIALVVFILSAFQLYLWLTNTVLGDADIHSVYFWGSMLLGGMIIFVIPIKKQTDYSDWSQLLHQMVLDNYVLAKYLFGREQKSFLKKNIEPNKKFVIVSGLARGGTTALTNLLYATTQFHSLSYGNMPFLLSPNIWKKVYNPKNIELKERAHGDRVLFGLDTVEALEEYFFKAHLNDAFITQDTLEMHTVGQDVYDAYINYQGIVNASGASSTYLAKNNNMMLRYPSLRQFNDEFTAIIMFRSPLDHAESLLKQHHRFSQLHQEDGFTLEYMDWLGHHEFGLNHKVFNFGLKDGWNKYDPTTMNYWLAIWVNYYTYILSLNKDKNLVLVDYDDLLYRPADLMNALGSKMELPLEWREKELFTKTQRQQSEEGIDTNLLREANDIMEKLRLQNLNVVNGN